MENMNDENKFCACRGKYYVCIDQQQNIKHMINILYELEIFKGDKLIYRLIRDYIIYFFYKEIDFHERQTLPPVLRIKTRYRLNKKQRHKIKKNENGGIYYSTFISHKNIHCVICKHSMKNSFNQICNDCDDNNYEYYSPRSPTTPDYYDNPHDY